jgi:Na+-transporting NADH:ubiquinone oxidoreductase subunit NqrE
VLENRIVAFIDILGIKSLLFDDKKKEILPKLISVIAKLVKGVYELTIRRFANLSAPLGAWDKPICRGVVCANITGVIFYIYEQYRCCVRFMGNATQPQSELIYR